MKIVTIQNKAVLNILLSGNTYIADMSRVPKNLIEPYKHMQRLYGWNTCPVFAAPVGYRVEFYGCRSDNGVLLCLDVPDEFIKLQRYYSWSDFIFYLENPDEDVPDASVIDYNLKEPVKDAALQATLPFIRPEWVFCYLMNVPERFLEIHDGSGGRSVLLDIDYYVNNSDKIITKESTNIFA